MAIARGEAEPYELHVPPEIDVRAIRDKAEMTQDRFASAFGFSVHQIRQWEQGRNRPLGAMRAYLLLIGQDPQFVLDVLHGGHQAEEPRIKRRERALA